MTRREFIALLGGTAVAWPFAARAQQRTMPVIGFLNSGSANKTKDVVGAFHKGLNETGYFEGQNVAIEYRWAEGHNDRLRALADDLVRLGVSVIAAPGGAVSPLAAKAATTTIPIVFQVGVDPVGAGLVASLNRPGGNVTGTTSLNNELGPKQLELIHQLVPTAKVVGLLINPTNVASQYTTRVVETAAHNLGLEIEVLRASSERDFDAVFNTLRERGLGALMIGPDPFLFTASAQLASFALSQSVPALSPYWAFAVAGGLSSYGGDVRDQFRTVGIYTVRILKGEKPADLPVVQSTKWS